MKECRIIGRSGFPALKKMHSTDLSASRVEGPVEPWGPGGGAIAPPPQFLALIEAKPTFLTHRI